MNFNQVKLSLETRKLIGELQVSAWKIRDAIEVLEKHMPLMCAQLHNDILKIEQEMDRLYGNGK